ncbi:MAG: hypothetical protein Q4B08_08900 [Propionibacteriaceae bacterium]|nr:hypothetical protein [Propionibacteriaceae bacterium]
MYIDPLWTPVIGEAIRWVRDLFTSKHQTRLEIDDLSRKIDQLLYGNMVLAQRQSEILAAVITELRTEHTVVVNHGTISFATTAVGVGADATGVAVPAGELSAGPTSSDEQQPPAAGSLFDGVEAAIAEARLTRPSERVK